ncbi:MAG: M20 metallopeptidase family protein [Pseudomonadota bacterium]
MNSMMLRANELKEEMISIRRKLHSTPEIMNDLPLTTKYVEEKLTEIGLEPKEIITSGLVATIGGKRPGKTILLRADMDGLNMPEESGLDFASKTQYAHTCGHDLHTTMLLGAARILKEREEEIDGTVKLMFQPGEEYFIGAKAMIEAGVLGNTRVDAAIGMHVMLSGPVGYIGYQHGYTLSSVDGFKITIKGKGCHGAMPEKGVDPINVGVHVYLALQELIAREVSGFDTAIITLGQFSAGAVANIIPDTCVLQGTMRTYSKEVRDYLFHRIQEVIDLTCKTYRASFEYEVLSNVPSLYTDPELLDEMLGYINEMGGDFTYNKDARATPTDDFAFIAERVPSAHFQFNCRVQDEGGAFPQHHPKVIFDENVLPVGAAVIAQCAFEWLRNNK